MIIFKKLSSEIIFDLYEKAWRARDRRLFWSKNEGRSFIKVVAAPELITRLNFKRIAKKNEEEKADEMNRKERKGFYESLASTEKEIIAPNAQNLFLRFFKYLKESLFRFKTKNE